MGDGIVTQSGADPVDEWNMRIVSVRNPALTTHARRFLSGEEVSSATGNPDIAVADLANPGGHTFTLSMPGAPVVLDIKVQAVPASFITTQEPDSRSSTPSPDNWLVDPDEAALTWELFNCVVLTVWPRSSTP